MPADYNRKLLLHLPKLEKGVIKFEKEPIKFITAGSGLYHCD